MDDIFNGLFPGMITVKLPGPKPVDKIFPEEAALVRERKCPFCKKDINTIPFRDELSKKEFRISGICQNCQDEVFKEEE